MFKINSNYQTFESSFVTSYMAAIGTVWSLLGCLWSGHRELFFFQKLYSMSMNNTKLC